MGSIRKKLHSTKGASMMIALLFFCVSVVIGSLILTGATASAFKVMARYEDQQDYLAVSSAARLIKDAAAGYTYTMGKTWEAWETGETDPVTGEPVWTGDWIAIEPFISGDSSGTGDLLTDGYEITKGHTRYNKEFNITAQEGVPAVHAVLTMEVGGDTQITLSCGKYTATVSFTARTSRVTDYVTYDYNITSWSHGTIEKGESE